MSATTEAVARSIENETRHEAEAERAKAKAARRHAIEVLRRRAALQRTREAALSERENVGSFGAGEVVKKLLALRPPPPDLGDDLEALKKFVSALADLQETGTLTEREVSSLYRLLASLFVARRIEGTVGSLFGSAQSKLFFAASGSHDEYD